MDSWPNLNKKSWTVSTKGSAVVVGPQSTLDELEVQKCQKCSEKPSQKILDEYLDVKNQVEKILGKSDIVLGQPEQCVRYGILLPKLFWNTVRKNCSINQEKLLKF